MPDLFLVEPIKTIDAAVPDIVERQQALDIRASWVVEAPAGSGKTGLLIQRYLKLLADESVESPEQILAITFTTKATTEMRERVLAQLRSAANGEKPANAFDRDTYPMAEAVLIRDRAMDWQLLDQPTRLKIRTIDSVCSDIASSLPLLSGSGGQRATVEDAMPLYLTAARRTFMQLGGEDHELDRALHLILLHRDGNLPECEKLLAGMLEHREQWGELIPLGRQRLDDAWLDTNVLPRLELALEQAICTALTQLAKTIPVSILSQLTTAAAEMAHIAGYKGGISPIAICAGRHTSPRETSEDLAHWRALIHLLVTTGNAWRKSKGINIKNMGFMVDKVERARIESLVSSVEEDDDLLAAICRLGSLPPAKYPQEQWVVAKALFRILNRALAELQLVFAERFECDFAELALAARTALRHDDGAHDLESASSIHLQHLLVDEMQDTSSSQYELIQMLTRNWDGHSQTVFLVGDPKQSIYLFRQARVERFLRTMRSQQLGDLPLGVLRLTANFRSEANLVTEFNEDFASIFPSAASAQHPEEVPFVKAFAIRPKGPATLGRVWHTNICPNADPPADARNKMLQRKSDAAAIRDIVERWQSKPLPASRPMRDGRPEPWKIAVLVRSRNHLNEIVAAFQGDPPNRGRHSELSDESLYRDKNAKTSTSRKLIPYRAVDIEPLETRPEIQDLFALTRALLHPADRTAWLAILHAPWCGLSLAELHTITGADDPTLAQRTMMQLIADRGDLLEGYSLERLERVWPVLEAAVAAAGRLPLAQTIERTWRSLGGNSYLQESELANARRYLQLLDEIEAQSTFFDLSALQRKITKLYAAPVVHPTAVDLLTMHKAKGLEWDVVIVPALERTAGSNRHPLLSWVELDSPSQDIGDEAAHILLAPITGKGEASQELNKWITSIHRAREAAERKRLFYVACTRAREELHLFASSSLSAKGEVQRKTGSLLEAAWPAAEPYLPKTLKNSESQSSPIDEEQETFAIAARASEVPEAPETSLKRPAILQRLPLSSDPAAGLRSLHPLRIGKPDQSPSTPHFERPEGSVAARAFGNAVHAFLDRITQQLATGTSAASILASLPAWAPRIAALLRSEGLQPAMVERLTQRVSHALGATIVDSVGLWLLSPHENASTEFALTTWSTRRTAVRIDRVFFAGAEPFKPGSDHLWIIDYKTTTHSAEGVEAFLANERVKYAPQLETYAAIFGNVKNDVTIKLALYYPILTKLVAWDR